jgi:two-component system LytT family response regulator
MRAIIVEDEPKNTKILKKFLSDYLSSIHVVGEANSIQKTKDLYFKLKPELLFLDIQLSDGNAFELLDEIMPVNCEIIFITAYDSYAIKAFKYSAVDYLLKPINLDELRLAIKNAEERLHQKTTNQRLQRLIENLNKPHLEKLALNVENEIVFVDTHNIMYCKARGNQTSIHTTSNKTLVASQSIGQVEEILAKENFFRIHNSFLINVKCVAKYIKGRGGIVVMQDGTRIEVAARRKDEFLSSLQSLKRTYLK